MRNGKNGSASLLTAAPFRINEKKEREYLYGNMSLCKWARSILDGIGEIKGRRVEELRPKLRSYEMYFFVVVRIHFIAAEYFIQKKCNMYIPSGYYQMSRISLKGMRFFVNRASCRAEEFIYENSKLIFRIERKQCGARFKKKIIFHAVTFRSLIRTNKHKKKVFSPNFSFRIYTVILRNISSMKIDPHEFQIRKHQMWEKKLYGSRATKHNVTRRITVCITCIPKQNFPLIQRCDFQNLHILLSRLIRSTHSFSQGANSITVAYLSYNIKPIPISFDIEQRL